MVDRLRSAGIPVLAIDLPGHGDDPGPITDLHGHGDAVRVEVRDDGVGSRESSADGKGLLGMRERAELLGGTLEAGPAEGGGFRVLARLPLPTSLRGTR